MHKDIQLALDTKLATLVGSPQIAWTNVNFTPTMNTFFLRPTVLGTASHLTLSGLYEVKGIYQVDLFYPSSSGVGAILDQVDAIKALFEAAVLTSGSTSVHIMSINKQPMINEQEWLHCPLDINFLAYI